MKNKKKGLKKISKNKMKKVKGGITAAPAKGNAAASKPYRMNILGS